ncbi:MAG: 2-oxo-4-hydroxy-4-carboxy-5-ureidoimidazoline decarboxylase [Chroococcidiopsidaceae cyanobacterium CP_BM_ER_R8_30]|nr:2-oxo-4-hydroxy-4-carboxy-5-ureidoimidazoline decarboxylase [Chroococcidiopsidaceae cyanobacterium CP_BM_ER_R8_30]
MPYSITELNKMSREEFVNTLGTVFENTPDIAYRVWNQRPFTNVAKLHQCMVDVVKSASRDEQLKLIQAHPELGSKATMAEASVKEQAGAGLAQLSFEEYNRFQALNRAYKDKFGFPFIIAVKQHTKDSILESFEYRLENPIDVETEQALTEIAQIARFRLAELVSE